MRPTIRLSTIANLYSKPDNAEGHGGGPGGLVSKTVGGAEFWCTVALWCQVEVQVVASENGGNGDVGPLCEFTKT
jgi:hypothetical protein